MEPINTHNYESFLLDYTEGDLSTARLEELKIFVLSHPELEIDLGDMDLPKLTTDTIEFPGAALLRKQLPYSVEEKIFDFLEGNMTASDAEEIKSGIASDPALAAIFDKYKKTVLYPDPIVFDNKGNLKKTEDDLILSNVALNYFEQQLDDAEKLSFEKLLENNGVLAAEQELFGKTFLQADLSIVYPQKDKLKKRAKIIFLFPARILTTIAAAVFLVFGFVFLAKFILPDAVAPVKNVSSADRMPLPVEKKQVKTEKKEFFESDPSPKRNSIVRNTEEQPRTAGTVTAFGEKLSVETQVVFQSDTSMLVKELPRTVDAQISTDPGLSATHYTDISELAVEDELSDLVNEPQDKSLWKRAVQLARKANKLGMKSIDGEEEADKKYRLSFNAFSIEKK